MKRIWTAIGLLAGPLLFTGCATHRQMSEAQMELYEIRQENRQIKSTLAHVDSLLADQNAALRKFNADFYITMQELQDRMSLIEGQLKDAGAQINQATSKFETNRPTNPDDTTAGAQKPDELNPESIYRAAYYDVIKGNYDLAIKGMREYLKSYSKTSLADNALYWIGECYYTQKEYEKAQESYERLIKEYPQSENIPAAKLKLGMCLYNLKNKTKAKQHFQDVVKDYPGTEEANQAADMLKRYDNR
jgi:tol-pal system protein YbgF